MRFVAFYLLFFCYPLYYSALSMDFLVGSGYFLSGYQFDYVFDWTILKYPQIGGSSRGRVKYLQLFPFVYHFVYMDLLFWFLVPFVALKWEGRSYSRTICRKARENLRSAPVKFFLFRIFVVFSFLKKD